MVRKSDDRPTLEGYQKHSARTGQLVRSLCGGKALIDSGNVCADERQVTPPIPGRPATSPEAMWYQIRGRLCTTFPTETIVSALVVVE